jgi:inhibitor of KinA
MRILPLNDGSILVEFAQEMSLEANRMAVGLAKAMDAAPFPGYIESVPAYASVAVFYDPAGVQTSLRESPHSAVERIVRESINGFPAAQAETGRSFEIPVDFSPEFSPDLDTVADLAGISSDDVVAIFCQRTYRVFMVGFLPGFAYMGEVDERIAAARRAEPRLSVPAGSVGIAGRQTGIYPFSSPGGWQLIGRTDLQLFSARRDPPCTLAAGDSVRFVPAAK